MNTAAVYTLRKIMKGLVCGPMDKNNGELCMVCPVLYKEAMDKLYSADGADYRVVHPKKLTSYKKAKYKGADLLDEIPYICAAAHRAYPVVPETAPSRRFLGFDDLNDL